MLVTSAAEAAAADAATIASGVPARALMQRAGAAATGEIVRLFGDRLRYGVAVFAGTGNNGGDAWVVARSLAAAGVTVNVEAAGDAGTADSAAERSLAQPLVNGEGVRGDEKVVVDGLLGTGGGSAPREPVAGAIERVRRMRAGGASIVALDVPSGLDATTGASEHSLTADVTLVFGTLKRGLLAARAHCGRIIVLDIGLTDDLAAFGGSRLVTPQWVAGELPRFGANAHKGDRRKVAIVGGAPGMAGAVVLGARAAARSGAGMVRAVVHPESVSAVQVAVPEATCGEWPADDEEFDEIVGDWADAVLLGPGLGRSARASELLARVLNRWRGPIVLDADALNLIAARVEDVRPLLEYRPALLTPHAAEAARLARCEVDEVMARRWEIAPELAERTGATVLLKGVPTMIAAPNDALRFVSASGTPLLAAAGSGDILGGIAVTLLAQMHDASRAGACAAWVHGHAAELTSPDGSVRGLTLGDTLSALVHAWPVAEAPAYPSIAELPPVASER